MTSLVTLVLAVIGGVALGIAIPLAAGVLAASLDKRATRHIERSRHRR